MAWKIGDLGYGLLFLTLIMGGLSFVFLSMDESVGVSSSLTTGLQNLSSPLSGTGDMYVELSRQVDNVSSLTADPNSELETRASSTSGVFNLFSKNIAVNFFRGVSQRFGVPSVLLVGVLGFIGVTVTVLFTRFFFGGDKV